VFSSNNAYTARKLSEYKALKGHLQILRMDNVSPAVAHAVLSKELHNVKLKDTAALPDKKKAAAVSSASNDDMGLWTMLRRIRELSSTFTKSSSSSKQDSKSEAKQQADEVVTKTNIDGDECNEEREKLIWDAVKLLGGHPADLDSLVVRCRSGSSLPNALGDMVAESRDAVVQRGFGSKLFQDESGFAWTQPQLWNTIQRISATPDANATYDELLYKVFKGDELALRGLIKSSLIRFVGSSSTVDGDGSRVQLVEAGSPLLRHTFDRLNRDADFFKGMNNLHYNKLIAKQHAIVSALEDELIKVEQTPRGGNASRRVISENIQRKLAKEQKLLMEYESKLVA
jgi:hypothetical protein